jgi:hypothetical protein
MIPGTSSFLCAGGASVRCGGEPEFSIRHRERDYAVNSDGTVTNGGSFYEKWISIAASAGNYDVWLRSVSGPTPTGTLNTWVALKRRAGR